MKQLRDTSGVMNSDLAPRRLKPGDYLHAFNIRNSGSTGNQYGYIEPVRGNQKREFALPAGSNTCVGYFSDEDNYHVYAFIANGNNDHLILRYNYATTQFTVILKTDVLKFNPNQRIVEAAIIGDQLFFNDAVNEVRRVDMTNTQVIYETFPDQLPDIWEFTATLAPNGSGQVELVGSGPLPSDWEVGTQICIIRNWRDAWVDAYDPSGQIGGATITVQSMNGGAGTVFVYLDGALVAPSINFPDGTTAAELAALIAQAIDQYIGVASLDLGAYVDPDNSNVVILTVPEGTGIEFNGTPVTVNVNWTFTGDPTPPATIVSTNISGIVDETSFGCDKAKYHCYDPNPIYSGLHSIIEINGNNIVIDAEPTGIQDEVELGGVTSYIPGRAYTHVPYMNFNLPFEEDMIKLYRANPPFAPCVSYRSDSSVQTNNLRGKLYQFKTRYIYANGMKSVPSPISPLPTPLFEKNIPYQTLEVWRDNVIDVWFDTGGKDVESIEVMVRESSNAANQDWAVLPVIRKDAEGIRSNTSYKLSFYGNEVRVNLDPAVAEQPMDYIPHVAGAFTFIRDNRNAIGNCDEGFDHVDVQTTTALVSCAEDKPRMAVMFRRWPPADLSLGLGVAATDLGAPISQDIMFPLNKRNEIDQSSYYIGGFGPGAGTDFITFWRVTETNSPAVPFIFSAEQGQTYSDGWEYSDDNPSVIGFVPGDPSEGSRAYNFFTGNENTYPWIPILFSFYTGDLPSGAIPSTSLPPVGAFISITVRLRLSKYLVWSDRATGQTPQNSSLQIYNNSGILVDTVEGILGFEANEQTGQNGFLFLQETFTYTVEAGDTPQTIRDYFKDQINNSPVLNTEITVRFAMFETPGFNAYTSEATIEVGVVAEDTPGTVGYPTDFDPPDNVPPNSTIYSETPLLSNLYIRPSVDFVQGTGSDSISTTNGMTFGRMRVMYEKIGANRLTANATVSAPQSKRSPKTGASHQYGIEYKDSVGRKWTISPVEATYIPYYSEDNGLGKYQIQILFRIFNLAPAGATHFQLMYAGNLTMESWIQFEVNWVDFDADNDGIKIALSPRLIRYNNAVNLGDDTDLTAASGRSELAYSWTRGDRIRFLSFWGGDQTDEAGSTAIQDVQNNVFLDAEIIGEATDDTLDHPGLVIVVNKNDVLPFISQSDFGSGSLVEVYTPKENAREDQLVYREIGEVFKIDLGRHRGNRINQGGTTPGAVSDYAEIILKNFGDAFVISREKLPEADVNRSKTRIVEAQNFSDFYPSTTWGPGAANLYNPEARREKKQIIRFSDFILGTQNGLNRYFDGNVNDEPDIADGEIRRLICPDDFMYVMQELNTGIIGVNVAELTNPSGTSSLLRSDQVLGQIRYIPGGWGITNQRESAVLYDGIIFFASQNRGAYVMISGQQIEAISRLGMDDYWNTVLNNLGRQQSDAIRILSDFDPKYGELIVHVPGFVHSVDPNDFTNLQISQPRTLSFSLSKKGWITDYAYHPEMLGRYRNKLLSWKSGQLYVHDETENWNEFYDGEEAQDSTIKIVFNDEETAVKFAKWLGVESIARPKKVVMTTDYRSGQQTSMFAKDFRYEESQYFVAVRRNSLTPGVTNPTIRGDVMRGTHFVVEITFGVETKFELYAVSLDSEESKRTISRR